MWLQLSPGFVLLCIASCLAMRTEEPRSPTPVSRNTPEEGQLEVRLNHFMAFNTDTFKMRYYYNNEFGYSHIVIFVGGAWAISPGWITGGLAHELARSLNAGLFYTEHRFYGESKPFADTSVPGLRFLTVDQALADLAQFIEYIKSDRFENGAYRSAKVALVGCSYAGSMATWMRLAYPHLVDAAFSDSGPLRAQEDFSEYLETIATAIKVQGGEQCLSSIEEGMQRLVELLQTQNGPATVSEMFNTCSIISATEPLDLASFFRVAITESFSSLVENAAPEDIPAACDVLTNSAVADPVQRLANWITSQEWTKPCIETSYQELVSQYTDTSFDSSVVSKRLWTYQTCVEFGWNPTTSSSSQPFLSTVPLEYYHQMCKDFFSEYFDDNLLRSGIERTNLFFGGGHLPDRVVTVLGGHDPWTPVGPNVTAAHSLAPVYLVPGISHCQAIQSTGSSDNEELEETKRLVLQDMRKFLLNETVADSAGSLKVSVALLAAVMVYILM